MQKRADDPREVAALARRQERELRSLARRRSRRRGRARQLRRGASLGGRGGRGRPPGRGRGGDRRRLRRSTSAPRPWSAPPARRCMNAAKHAPEPGPIRVFAEVEAGSIEVFVRDRGPGFDPAAVPADRRGVRESIIGRMSRAGGRAEIRSAGRRRHRGRPRDRPRRARGGRRAPVSAEPPSVVIVDDHALFRAGVRAELEGLVEVRAEAGAVSEAVAAIARRAARRGPARRPHAGRRRRRGDPPGRRGAARRSASSRSRSPTPPRT